VRIKTQAELDAMTAAGACIHVDGDAEQSVKGWYAERQLQAEADRAAGAQP
jgi:hypothetical protein